MVLLQLLPHLERVQPALSDFGIAELSDLILQLRSDPDALASHLEDHLGTQYQTPPPVMIDAATQADIKPDTASVQVEARVRTRSSGTAMPQIGLQCKHAEVQTQTAIRDRKTQTETAVTADAAVDAAQPMRDAAVHCDIFDTDKTLALQHLKEDFNAALKLRDEVQAEKYEKDRKERLALWENQVQWLRRLEDGIVAGHRVKVRGEWYTTHWVDPEEELYLDEGDPDGDGRPHMVS